MSGAEEVTQHLGRKGELRSTPLTSDAKDGGRATVVLHVGGLRFATEAAAVEHAIGRQPGVVEVLANPSAQTATVTYEPARTGYTAPLFYKRTPRGWTPVPSKVAAAATVPALRIDQGLNTPPRLVAVDPATQTDRKSVV